LGAPSIRFNFRGTGNSAGRFDDGHGETADTLAVIAAGRQRWPGAALWLAGFSFGGVVALRASVAAAAGAVARLVTVAPALGRAFADPADIALPACPWLIVQGDDRARGQPRGAARHRALLPRQARRTAARGAALPARRLSGRAPCRREPWRHGAPRRRHRGRRRRPRKSPENQGFPGLGGRVATAAGRAGPIPS
jgi:pimeloyl-ACP methyl ester carboxylesterase